MNCHISCLSDVNVKHTSRKAETEKLLCLRAQTTSVLLWLRILHYVIDTTVVQNVLVRGKILDCDRCARKINLLRESLGKRKDIYS